MGTFMDNFVHFSIYRIIEYYNLPAPKQSVAQWATTRKRSVLVSDCRLRQVRAKQRSRCPCYIAPTLSPTAETSKVRNVCYCTHEYEWWSKDHPAELSEESPGNVQFLGLLVFGVETKFPLPETTVGKLMVTFPDNKYKMFTYGKMYKIFHKRTNFEGFRLVIQKMDS